MVEVSLKAVERSVSSANIFALAFGCEPISGGRSPVTVVRLGSRNHAAHCTVNTVYGTLYIVHLTVRTVQGIM